MHFFRSSHHQESKKYEKMNLKNHSKVELAAIFDTENNNDKLDRLSTNYRAWNFLSFPRLLSDFARISKYFFPTSPTYEHGM